LDPHRHICRVCRGAPQVFMLIYSLVEVAPSKFGGNALLSNVTAAHALARVGKFQTPHAMNFACTGKVHGVGSLS